MVYIIEFYPAQELSGIFHVNEEGEVYLPRLNEVNVSGLTPSELEKLLEDNYSKFLISPTIKVKIAIFKEIKVTVTGEVRYPGTYKFPSYKSSSLSNFLLMEKTLKKLILLTKLLKYWKIWIFLKIQKRSFSK